MTNKAVRYGLVGVAVVLLVVITFAGAASAVVYEINNSSDWKNYVTGNHACVLVNDIDFDGGSAYVSTFSGTLDGRNFTIYNFNISGTNNVGLFGTYRGSSISNININNFSVSGNYGVSCLVGVAYTACTIKNVNIENGKVFGVGNVGGMIGDASYENDVFEDCIVKNCTISGGGVGGLVGCSHGSSLYITESWVVDCVISGGSGGGLVGDARKDCKSVVLKNCVVENCVVNSSSGYSGGCYGYNEYTSDDIRIVDNCTVRNCAIFSTSGSRPCGGVIGGSVQSSIPTVYPSVSNCTVEFCTIAGNGDGAVGGIAGTFPSAGIMERNKVISSTIVSKSGKAAGICPVAS